MKDFFISPFIRFDTIALFIDVKHLPDTFNAENCDKIEGCGILIRCSMGEDYFDYCRGSAWFSDLSFAVNRTWKHRQTWSFYILTEKTDAFSIHCNGKKSVVLNLILVIYSEIPLL